MPTLTAVVGLVGGGVWMRWRRPSSILLTAWIYLGAAFLAGDAAHRASDLLPALAPGLLLLSGSLLARARALRMIAAMQRGAEQPIRTDALGRKTAHSSDETVHLQPAGLDEDRLARVLKRLIDLVFGTAGAIFTAPLQLLAMLLVVAEDGWPPLHRQVRCTLHGRNFRILKIRTMIRNAEPQGQAIWSRGHDPRITRVGRILRRTWIDEFPQFFQVVRGDLSLIGPRPERPEFIPLFSGQWPTYRERMRVRAGLTGWAQARGYSGDTSIEARLAHDLAYIARWSPWLDIKIVVATILRFFRRSETPAFVLGDPWSTQESSASANRYATELSEPEETCHRFRGQPEHLPEGDQRDRSSERG